MGWKIAGVLTREEGRTLQTFVDEVYREPQQLRESTQLACQAMNPGMFERFALTFAGFHWVFDWRLAERSLSKPLPVAYRTWVFMLHSVVNGYGFSTQADGVILRSRSGNGSDDQIEIDRGEPSATERSLVTRFANPGREEEAWHAWCHTDTSFEGPIEAYTTHDIMGEDVVFGLIEELVGFRMDADSTMTTAFDNARVQEIVRRPGFFARLFGR